MIHLINMPLAFITAPSLALGTFSTQLRRAGMDVKVFNLNISFAKEVGFERYLGMAFLREVDPRIAEWLFAEAAWGQDPSLTPEAAFLSECERLFPEGGGVTDHRQWLRRLRREVVPEWLDACVSDLLTAGPIRVAGFSCNFFQTLPALALGRRIKARFPEARIVCGGCAFHGDPGAELLAKVPWIDAVCLGEADDVVVPLMHALYHGRAPANLPGIYYRNGIGAAVAGEEPRPVSAETLEALPDPSFEDFFEAVGAAGLLRDPGWRKRAFLPFEGARGCWKAAKQHCRFCGTDMEKLSFRPRSAKRVVGTLSGHKARYPVKRYHAVDSNMPPLFFRDLLPRLQQAFSEGGASLFYEVVSQLGRDRVKALADAGITTVQAGIESLRTPLLSHMEKGGTALQNVFFLKCCREHGVTPLWNFLVRIPGETRQDYAAQAKMIPHLTHLRPPLARPFPVQCHRFSPYYREEGRWLLNVRPQFWYSALYPPERIDLSKVAYYFDADWKDVLAEEVYGEVSEKIAKWIEGWKEPEGPPKLLLRRRGGLAAEICDTRTGTSRYWPLSPLKARLYDLIADPLTAAAAIESLTCRPQERFRATAVSPEGIGHLLCQFVEDGLAISENGRYLALATNEETASTTGTRL